MSNGSITVEDYLPRARKLVMELEEGNEQGALEALGELTMIQESNMFRELGKLTRELHDTMSAFHIDPQIIGIAEHDIPDAKERLNYVITMTDQAAHKTLNAVEKSIPLCEEIDKTANELGKKWERFIAREISADEFRALSKQIKIFFNSLTSNSMKIKEELNGVLIAQDFQDLTGQTIRRVIKMVQDVEESLVKYIKLSSLSAKSSGEVRKDSNSELEGPQIPGSESAGAVKSQDEVDDLLSSLGF